MNAQRLLRFAEWPTLAMLVFCYAIWCLGTTYLSNVNLGLGMAVTGNAVALHSSLSHEIIHGHPFRWQRLNEALVFPGFSILIPYLRFRDTHLAHHLDADLTDPYDDPESNYLDPEIWNGLPIAVRFALNINNTLLGRMCIGVLVSQVMFMMSDWRQRDRAVIIGWAVHAVSVGLVFGWLATIGSMPIWAYLIAAYIGLSLIKIRTFLEHQAHARALGRTAIIEDRGLLSFLFLNNNLHAVHHAHPRTAWYALPALYFSRRDQFLKMNGGYSYQSYREVFRQHLFKRKDPVPHPFWR